jgi:hypothetical protein
MINLPLLKQRGLRLLTGRKTYKDLSDQQWTLCAAESSISPPAIYLPGELDKVTGVIEQTTYKTQLQRIKGGLTQHAATTAYRLRNVEIHDGYIYKGAMKLPLTTTKESWFNQDKTEYISEAALACTFCGNRYFGDWMNNDVLLNLAARELAMAVRTSQTLSPNQIEYSHLFEINSTPVTHAKFKELIIIEDYAQNQFKRRRYQYLRNKIKPLGSSLVSPGVMLLRGKSGVQRCLVNEDKIAEFLRSQGFIIIDPEQTPATEIVRQIVGTKMIIGVEGSQLANGLFTVADNGVILTLQPPYRFNNVYKGRGDCLGIKYAFVVGREVEGGFEISIEDLVKTLEKIDLG